MSKSQQSKPPAVAQRSNAKEVPFSTTDVSTQRSFSCGICFELYTKEHRYPISLNCGHTFCLVCITQLSKNNISIMCSICRKHTFSNYKRLGKNYVLLDILERSGLLEADEKQENKDKRGSNVCGTSSSSGFGANSDFEDHADNEDGEDSFSTAVSFGRDGVANEYNNLLSVSNIELEDFYNMLESVRDYYFLAGVRVLPREREEQLAQFRREMSDVESNLGRLRRTFYDIYARVRQLVITVRQSNSASGTSNAIEIPPPPPSDNRFTGVGFTPRAVFLPNNFYDDIFGMESMAFTGSDDEEDGWTEGRLSRNFMRREGDTTLYCYLCGVRFRFSSETALQHVRGRRHRELLTANHGQDGIIFEEDEGEDVFSANYHNIGPFSVSARSRSSLPFFVEMPNGGMIHLGHGSNSGTENAAPRFGRGGGTARYGRGANNNSHQSTSNNASGVPSSDSHESAARNFGSRLPLTSNNSTTSPSNNTSRAWALGSRSSDVQDDREEGLGYRPATARSDTRNQTTSSARPLYNRNQSGASSSNSGDLRTFGRPFIHRSNSDALSNSTSPTANDGWGDHDDHTIGISDSGGVRSRGGTYQQNRFNAARPAFSSTANHSGGRGFTTSNSRDHARQNSGYGAEADFHGRRQFQPRRNNNYNNHNNNDEGWNRNNYGRRGNRGGGFGRGNRTNNNYHVSDEEPWEN